MGEKGGKGMGKTRKGGAAVNVGQMKQVLVIIRGVNYIDV